MPQQPQPTPVPTTMPPKKRGKGLVATIVVVIVLGLAAVAGTWYYMNKKLNDQKAQQQQQIDQLNQEIQKLKDSSSSSSNQKTSETADWQTLHNTKEMFTIKYPQGWVTKGCTADSINFIAENTNLLTNCNSDKPSQIVIGSETGDTRNSPNGKLTDPKYFKYEESAVTVSGVSGVRRVSTVISGTDFQYPAGTRYIYYTFVTNGRTYRVHNYQSTGNQEGQSPYPDITATFDTMVQQTLQFK